MPKETPGRHARASLQETARQIHSILDKLTTTIELMDAPPASVDQVTIQRERSRKDGIKYLQTWSDAARDAVNEARDKASRSIRSKMARENQEHTRESSVSENSESVSGGQRKRKKSLSKDGGEDGQ